jgi:hypothetical protein
MDIHASSEIWNFFKKYSLSANSVEEGPEFKEGITMQVFPNPVSRHATLEFNSDRQGQAAFRLYDFSGRLVKEEAYPVPGRVLFDTQSLPPGVYLGIAEQGERSYKTRIVIR